MPLYPLRAAWESFERNVIGRKAGEVQRQVMREAWYAGAFAAYAIICRSVLSPEKMKALQNELVAFERETLEAVQKKKGALDA